MHSVRDSFYNCWGGSRGGSGGSVEPPKPVDYDAVVQKLAEQQPRRMLLADPIFEESWIFNLNEFKMFIRLDYCQC